MPFFADPCDGYACHNNPSGIFPDPYNKNGFIQCGCDYNYGKPCVCCVPFHFSCPYGTQFSAYAGRCVDDGKASKDCFNAVKYYTLCSCAFK